jgi:hypothetical protein
MGFSDLRGFVAGLEERAVICPRPMGLAPRASVWPVWMRAQRHA